MHFTSIIALLGLAAGSAKAACPYAEQHRRSVAAEAAAEAPVSSPAPKAKDLRRRNGTDGIFYMNRIGPTASQLYIANADGSNATALMGNQSAPFDFHASWSPDGEWIVFTSERRADGQADLYRVRTDGSGLETLVQTDSVEDVGVLSPDGTKLAYVSTYGNYTSNVWVRDLATNVTFNLTDTPSTRGAPASPQGYFRPAWSPDGEWLAFSSDRNTDWTGHSDGTGWEHTQTLSLYVIRPNGSDFRLVRGVEGYSLGHPIWSPDGTRLLYTIFTTEDTYAAHGTASQVEAVSSQIESVDVATGEDVVTYTDSDSVKIFAHWIGDCADNVNIGYVIKAGDNEGINYTAPDATHQAFAMTSLRNPSWSPDGSRVVYEVFEWGQREGGKELFSFDSAWDYRFMDVFPMFNNATSRMAITAKQLSNSTIVTSSPTYTDLDEVFDPFDVWSPSNATEQVYVLSGLGGAFQPTWSPDGSQIAFGLGTWFFDRNINPAALYIANTSTADDSDTSDIFFNITEVDGLTNAGFPSYSPDGTKIVYRLWDWINGTPLGLRILDLTTGVTTNLTDGWDNTPGWSPNGELIVFTRQVNWTAEYGARWYEDRFDVMTIKPDGTELNRVTDSLSNDAHAVWSYDNRIMWNSGMYGFRDECALYDDTFQPYGQIMIMDADGSNKRMLTDSLWEDSMPLYIPAEFL